jgi:hypothetical protein
VSTATGMLNEAIGGSLMGSALMLSAGAGSIAAGVPLVFMPAPLIAAGGLAMYLDSGLLRDYFRFVAGAMVTGGNPATTALSVHFLFVVGTATALCLSGSSWPGPWSRVRQ